ncbi:GTP-binding protein [Mycobacterium tuberculosis]|uniref:GTP-binding protein n=1 Tax=Mycobacterium tuberculosis TaxID=1773 RepID=UPI0032B60F4C
MTTLLRLATAGSVDDGKSTLIGRLLYDSKAVMEDQWASVEQTSKDRGHDYTDLALVTDGLRAGEAAHEKRECCFTINAKTFA